MSTVCGLYVLHYVPEGVYKVSRVDCGLRFVGVAFVFVAFESVLTIERLLLSALLLYFDVEKGESRAPVYKTPQDTST